MKKTMKKIISLVLAMTMVMAMSITVFADDTKTYATSNLTISTSTGHRYEVYQLLKGDVSGLTDGSGKLSNIAKGANLNTDDTEAFVNAVKDLSGVALSDKAWEYVTGTAAYTVTGTGEAVSTEVTDGYYVVKDVDISENGGQTVSRYMVAVVGDTTMTPKATSTPTVIKKVKDVNDTTGDTTDWQDSADYDIGDSVPFELTATLPDSYDQYHTYYLSFNDTLSSGLTLQASTIKVYVGTTQLGNSSYYIYGNQNSFNVVIYDLKDVVDTNGVKVTAANGDKVIVDYSATLNENAVIGEAGNPNTVNLTYSTNPNTTTKTAPNDGDTPGTPSTPSGDNPDKPSNPGTPNTPVNPGTTPDDKVIVFTYKVDANKVTSDKSALAGAAFELLKEYKTENGSEFRTVSIQNATKNDDGTYTLISNTATTFEWKGIDDGTYKIVEVITPEGYNTIADQVFTVTAEHDVLSDDPKLTRLSGNAATGSVITFTADIAAGSLTTDIENKSGSVLPSTGGMGTTLFYVFGIILVAGAGVLLITRRRMAR